MPLYLQQALRHVGLPSHQNVRVLEPDVHPASPPHPQQPQSGAPSSHIASIVEQDIAKLNHRVDELAEVVRSHEDEYETRFSDNEQRFVDIERRITSIEQTLVNGDWMHTGGVQGFAFGG